MALQRLGSDLVQHEGSLLSEAFDDRIPLKYTSSPRDNMGAIATRAPKTIRVATWNLQGWNVAWTLYGKDLASKAMIRDRQERILNARVDFCGFQECLFGYEQPIETMAIPPLTNAFFGPADWGGDVALNGYKYGNAFVSRGTLTNTSFKVYDDQSTPANDAEKRSYTRTTMTIDGVSVTIFVTHLSLDATRRANMIKELVAAASAVSGRVIVMGDMNSTYGSGEWKGITDAGFTAVNVDDINTHPVVTWYIDNIFFKGFKSIVYKGAQDHPKGLSDHKMLIAELEV